MWVGELISEFLMGKEEKKVERRDQREGKQKERVVGRTPDGPGGPRPGLLGITTLHKLLPLREV